MSSRRVAAVRRGAATSERERARDWREAQDALDLLERRRRRPLRTGPIPPPLPPVFAPPAGPVPRILVPLPMVPLPFLPDVGTIGLSFPVRFGVGAGGTFAWHHHDVVGNQQSARYWNNPQAIFLDLGRAVWTSINIFQDNAVTGLYGLNFSHGFRWYLDVVVQIWRPVGGIVRDAHYYARTHSHNLFDIGVRRVTSNFMTFRQNYVRTWNNIVALLDHLMYPNDAFHKLGRINIYFFPPGPPAIMRGWMETPTWLASRKCVVNPPLNDNRCFAYAILASFHNPVDNPQRPSTWTRLLETTSLQFPQVECVEPTELNMSDWEEANPDCRLFVYGMEEESEQIEGHPLFTYYESAREFGKDVHVLVLSREGEDGRVIWHCFGITRFDSFARTRIGAPKKRAHRYCPRCLRGFLTEEGLSDHDCARFPLKSDFILPDEGSKLSFRSQKAMVQGSIEAAQLPFCIYLDYECMIKEGVHIPFAVGLTLVHNKLHSLPGWTWNPVDHFLTIVDEDPINLHKRLWHKLDMWSIIVDSWLETLTQDGVKVSQPEFHPHSDKVVEQMNEEDVTQVYHREYERQRYEIPVLMHNGKRYDFLIMLRYLGLIGKKPKWQAFVGGSMTGLMSFKFFQFCFLDTYLFTTSSLHSLLEAHRSRGTTISEWPCLMGWLQHHHPDWPFEKLLSKGIFPYSFLDSFEKLRDTLELPSIIEFHKDSIGAPVSEEEWTKAKEVWKETDCVDLYDWMHIYLMRDVLGLADVMQDVRRVYFEAHSLDLYFFLSLPHFSLNALLLNVKKNGDVVELVDQWPVYELFERLRRGGYAAVCYRYWAKEMGAMRYWDCNGLYPAAMQGPLPVSDFFMEDPTEWNEERILREDAEGEIGYVLEVDVAMPEHPSASFLAYPPLPHTRKIPDELLDPGMLDLRDSPSTAKLITSMFPRRSYVVSLLCLQQALRLGCRLLEIQQVLSFKQKPFMRDYILKNVALRAAATSTAEKSYHKLASTSVYGKMVENLKERKQMQVIRTGRKLEAYLRLPFLHEVPGGDCIFPWGIVIPSPKRTVTLNKPIQVGAMILERAKAIMVDFHHNVIAPIFPEAVLLMTDTDSLAYGFPGLSDEEVDAKLVGVTAFHPTELGRFKDECPPPHRLVEFVGLRPKCYAMLKEGEVESLRAKGIARNSLQELEEDERKVLRFEDFRTTLFEKAPLHIRQSRIAPQRDQTILSVTEDRCALSCFDDKYDRQFTEEDPAGLRAYPWGYVREES